MRFEAAHHLPRTPPGHKCRRVHGHSFVAEVIVSGALADSGHVPALVAKPFGVLLSLT